MKWLSASLAAELKADGDMNQVASELFALQGYHRRTAAPAVGELLEAAGRFLRARDAGSMDCSELVDAHLAGAFLREAGVEVEGSRVESRLNECDLTRNNFDLANRLLFVCRYTDWDHRARVPGGLERLEAAQRSDGAYTDGRGRPWFYLTSHALLAVHYCGGDPQVERLAQDRILRRLPEFLARGMIDALAESLLFLRWTGREVPGYARYSAFLKSRVQPDGGVCFLDRARCPAFWHAAAVMLELYTSEARNVRGGNRAEGRDE